MAELFPLKIRGVGNGFAVGGLWVMNAVVTWAFPVMIAGLGAARTYAIFALEPVAFWCVCCFGAGKVGLFGFGWFGLVFGFFGLLFWVVLVSFLACLGCSWLVFEEFEEIGC